ncbi:glycosyltransferase family 39 protein [Patescibacteria group bacterium]|nr:glycosyltransferase family 39 protein [Patescibacteria group bacterium]
MKQIKPFLPIILVLAFSAFFRLYRIGDYMEFLGDQGRDAVIVRSFLTQGHLMGIGPQTSIGNMYLGPWYYYLIAPALLLSNFNPIGPSILVAVFGIATSWLLWYFLKKIFPESIALTSAFLFAASPVVIKYTSFSWNPNIMPFFSLLFVFSLFEVFFEKKYSYLVLASIAFIFCLNSHYLALLLLPLPVALFFFRRPSSSRFWYYFLLACGLFLLSLLPQVFFDLKHHGQNIRAIIAFFSVRQTTVNLKPYKAIPQILPLLNQIITRVAAGKDLLWGNVLTAIFILGVIYSFFRKNLKLSPLFLIVLWLFFGVFGLSLYKQHIYDHYFAFLFVPTLILLAVTIYEFKYLGWMLLAVTTFFFLKENPLRYPPNSQMATVEKIDQLILDHSRQQPFNLALLAKQNYDPPYRYFLSLKKAPLFTLNEQKTQQLFVVCEPFQMDCQPLGNPLWDIAAFGPASISDTWKVNDITIFRLVPKTLAAPTPTPPTPPSPTK